MKKVTVISLLMLCTLGINAQVQFVPYTPTYTNPQQRQQQSQRRQQ